MKYIKSNPLSLCSKSHSTLIHYKLYCVDDLFSQKAAMKYFHFFVFLFFMFDFTRSNAFVSNRELLLIVKMHFIFLCACLEKYYSRLLRFGDYTS